jgi:hypothetical protein
MWKNGSVMMEMVMNLGGYGGYRRWWKVVMVVFGGG